MKCIAELVSIEDDYAVVKIEGDNWNLPLTIVPDYSRPGDIIQIQTGFCPFKTLEKMK